MNFTLNKNSHRFIFVFLLLISVVQSSWTTVELSYRICEQNKIAVLHFDETNKGCYGGYIGSEYNFFDCQFNADGEFFAFSLKGCNDVCLINVSLSPNHGNTPEIVGLPHYYCSDSPTEFDVHMSPRVTYYNEIFPNKTDPAAPSVTYSYCVKGINVDDGSSFGNSFTSISACIDAHAKQTGYSLPPFKTVLNLDAQTYEHYGVGAIFPPSFQRLVQTSLNFLAYHHQQITVTDRVFANLAEIAPEMDADLTPPVAPQRPRQSISGLISAFSVAFSTLGGGIFTLPLASVTSRTIGFDLQHVAAGAFATAADNIRDKGSSYDDTFPLGELQTKIVKLHQVAIDTLQNVADGAFSTDTPSTDNPRITNLFDSFVNFDSTAFPSSDMASQIYNQYAPAVASYILNYFDVVVCRTDTISNVCYLNRINKCRRCNGCNKDICSHNRTIPGAKDECLFNGGWANNAGGIQGVYTDYLNKITKYGNLADACAGKKGGWNITVADCMDDQYLTCCSGTAESIECHHQYCCH
ncbi:hypothetical protein C1645_838071 [Glomus cerebriforme]|uniref:Uncharacterized protein n=1 Tax=Glomus cerebriforme TaxID=658196 RepID=A0A397S9X7_9GLOM|nr:hypothetical protein C1645_838071 [Glomus cerebriforme]